MLAQPETYQFGHFRLDPGQRVLHANGAAVPLSSRAFDILLLLVQARDRVVGRDEITAQVWRGVHVDDNNLAVQMSALRRALHDGADAVPLIVTVPGRGYRFVGRVRPADQEAAAATVLPPPEQAAPGDGTKPRRAGRLVWLLLAPILLAGAGGLWLILGGLPQQSTAPRLSIAVLPFRNLGGAPDRDYMADAVTEDLTTDLAHLPGSLVIASGSTRAYLGKAVPIPQIGHELNVRYVLEGSLREADGLFHINAQLIDAVTDTHLWADRFDVPRERLSDTQSDIVRRIASALNVTLLDLEGARSLQARPSNPDALDLFFRARSLLNADDSLAGVTATQHLLEKAVALEPDFVDALTDLGWLLMSKVNDFDGPDIEADSAEARRVIAHALTLAPKNADALNAQGLLLTVDGRCAAGKASYEAALTIDANSLRAFNGIAYCAWRLARFEESIGSLTKAVRLDPLGPGNKQRMLNLGMSYFMMGRYRDAESALGRADASSLEPSDPVENLGTAEWTRVFLIASAMQAGDAALSKNLYAIYAKHWRYRTIWQLASFFTKPIASAPGFAAFASGLKQAGMPEFASDAAETHIAEPAGTEEDRDFSPTPAYVLGRQPISVGQLLEFLREPAPAIVVDVGVGAASPPDAVWLGRGPEGWRQQIRQFAASVRDGKYRAGTRFILVGSGPYEWDGYNAARTLVAAGIDRVSWLRGGEESLAASGVPTRDLRDP